MFGSKSLKFTGIITLCFFLFFVFTVETGWAQSKEEDTLSKAMRLYQEGDYEASINLLSQFIEKLKAMVEQKKNVAEAFYLLAKIYFEVGDDQKVDENLKKVFVTFPSFAKDETNFAFKQRFAKIKAETQVETEKFAEQNTPQVEPESKPQPRTRVISPAPTQKKKKFPIVLVIAAAVVVTGVVALVLLKKKDEKYDIRGEWTLRGTVAREAFRFFVVFSGSKTSGNFTDNDGDTGSYTVNGNNVNFEYNDYDIAFTGTFSNENSMGGSVRVVSESGPWTGTRGVAASASQRQSTAGFKAQFKKK